MGSLVHEALTKWGRVYMFATCAHARGDAVLGLKPTTLVTWEQHYSCVNCQGSSSSKSNIIFLKINNTGISVQQYQCDIKDYSLWFLI